MTEVELKYVELTPELLEEHLSKPEEVAMLDLSGNNISSEQCIALVKTYITNMPKLEALDLKDNKIGTEGAVELFQALQKYCPRLRYLDVNENGIQDDSLFDLATLVISCKYLTTLNVVTNHITMRGLPTLCDGLARSRSLTELSLAYNVLGDHGATTVAETLGRHCPTLLSLDLSDNRIGDEGAISVAEAFLLSSASRLESLNLSVNNIGDVGFKAIAEALTSGKNQRFKYLDLGCNASVGDAGRRTLTESASRMRSVHFIDFTSCNLSDDDATRLTVAILNPKSSLDGVEWFNNPRMTLPVEKCLFEAIETTKTRRSSSKSSRLFGVPPCMLVAAVGAAVLAVALTLRRTRQG